MGWQEDAIAAALAADGRKTLAAAAAAEAARELAAAEKQEAQDLEENLAARARIVIGEWLEYIGIDPRTAKIKLVKSTAARTVYHTPFWGSVGGSTEIRHAASRFSVKVAGRVFVATVFHPTDHPAYVTVAMHVGTDRSGRKEYEPAGSPAELGRALKKADEIAEAGRERAANVRDRTAQARGVAATWLRLVAGVDPSAVDITVLGTAEEREIHRPGPPSWGFTSPSTTEHIPPQTRVSFEIEGLRCLGVVSHNRIYDDTIAVIASGAPVNSVEEFETTLAEFKRRSSPGSPATGQP